MTTSDGGWARPETEPRHPMFEARRAAPATESADLDWVRQRLVELDDQQRSLPTGDIAARHAVLEATDGLRTMLRHGYAAELHAVREQWEQRAGRKGEHEFDDEAIAGMVRSMVPSQGR